VVHDRVYTGRALGRGGPVTAPLEFGLSITPTWVKQPEVLRLAQVADESGLDLVGIQDHPYQWRFFDTWTLIAYLAGRTSSVRFFPDVASLPLRPPAILAKAAASLDVLTGGRVELGLGAGSFWDAIEAMGGPRRTPGRAVEATEEAIDVIRLIWSGERGVRYEGRHYRLSGVHTGPKPAHDIGIWMGAGGPRMLDLLGRKADGWVPSAGWAPPEALPGYLRRIEDAAVAAGRDPRAIRRVYNISGAIGPETGERFTGPVSRWVEELAGLAETGMDAFIFWPGGDDPVAQAQAFASEVVPAVRTAVGTPG
jgi:alkanesulfonate monooxygenase SsuD/methylene tetrahydromethanopterin reductase-like flavin-dependent oxidoreductase (luciferase family)